LKGRVEASGDGVDYASQIVKTWEAARSSDQEKKGIVELITMVQRGADCYLLSHHLWPAVAQEIKGQ